VRPAQAELAAKVNTKARKNFSTSSQSAPRVAELKAAKTSGGGGGFSLPSFGNPFAGGAAPAAAAAPKAAESSASEGEGVGLLPVLLLLFSPLLIVQALSFQTVARLGTQAIQGTQGTKK
jgi:hypothetical protein